MSFGHDQQKFWTGFHQMKAALEAIDALTGPVGRAARASALEVLAGGATSKDVPPEVRALLMQLFAGFDKADRAVGITGDGCENPGSPSDRDTDEAHLVEFIEAWKVRLRRSNVIRRVARPREG